LKKGSGKIGGKGVGRLKEEVTKAQRMLTINMDNINEGKFYVVFVSAPRVWVSKKES
jgi:hypothetical protein